MRLLLIQPPSKEEGMTGLYPLGYTKEARSVLPPLGLLSLASYLKEKHDVEVLDMILLNHSVEDIPDILQAFKPDIVGVTAVIGLWASALEIVREVKRCNSSIYTVVGGPNATYYPEETLSHKEIDFVIVGNGQKPLMTLCNAIDLYITSGRRIFYDSLENTYVQGISYDGFDCNYSEDYSIDKFPSPDRRFTQYKSYTVPFCPENPSTTMITSMGCPFRCAFCTQNRPPIQLCSVRAVVDEMEEIEDLGIRSILFQDELFTLYRGRVRTVCEELLERGIRINWTVKSRVSSLRPWMPGLMKQAGCFNIHFGIESGNDATLRRMNKGYTRENVLDVVESVKKAGLSCTGNFMLAYPGETEEDILQTIAFAKELELDISQFSLTIDSPGSQLFEEALRMGRRTEDYFSEFTRYPDRGIPLEQFSASDRFSREQLQGFLDKAYISTRTLFDVTRVGNSNLEKERTVADE